MGSQYDRDVSGAHWRIACGRRSQPSGYALCIYRFSCSQLGQRSPKRHGVTSFYKVSSRHPNGRLISLAARMAAP